MERDRSNWMGWINYVPKILATRYLSVHFKSFLKRLCWWLSKGKKQELLNEYELEKLSSNYMRIILSNSNLNPNINYMYNLNLPLNVTQNSQLKLKPNPNSNNQLHLESNPRLHLKSKPELQLSNFNSNLKWNTYNRFFPINQY